MKKILLFVILSLSAFTLMAQQDSWKIKINTKTLLNTAKEDMETNRKTVKSSDWKKNGNLEILFTESEKNTWIRSFLFYDKDDNEILRKDSITHAKISLKELRKLFAGKKEIHIYTTKAPVDPNLAIRMRRVHLCTLRLP